LIVEIARPEGWCAVRTGRCFVPPCFLLLTLSAPAARAGDDIDAVVAKAVAYLKGVHKPADAYRGGSRGLGGAALSGLALLESGVPADDPAVANVAKFVRDGALGHDQTYGVALAILFLDRLNDPADRPLVQALGVRLLSAQTQDGGFSYTCLAVLSPKDEARLRAAFARDLAKLQLVPKDAPKKESPKAPDAKPAPAPPALHPEVARWAKLANVQEDVLQSIAGADGSNTQFAVLALWVARKHGVPCEAALAAAERYARAAQNADGGWPYSHLSPLIGEGSTAPMTCSGLLCLAVAHGVKRTLRAKGAEGVGKKEADAIDDPAVRKGLRALGAFITAASGRKPDPMGRKRYRADELNGNLYFLWSLGRVAVAYDLETVGGHDWYAYGADTLVEAQQADGSWRKGKYLGSDEEVNTAFALLFLRRANAARDLTATLRSKSRRDPPPARVEPAKGEDADAFGKEAARLARQVIAAGDAERAALLARLRDAKGGVHTEALARAAVGLTGDARRSAREALAARLTRMTAATLRGMLKDSDREIRLAAAACGAKGAAALVPDLIGSIADADDAVAQAARLSLRKLTGQDFGPREMNSPAEKQKAADAWQQWWKMQHP
jgi:hypothetical protein